MGLKQSEQEIHSFLFEWKQDYHNVQQNYLHAKKYNTSYSLLQQGIAPLSWSQLHVVWPLAE